MNEKKYNGWSNYPTWNVKLWIDNDEALYDQVKDIFTKYNKDVPIWNVARDIRDLVQEGNPIFMDASMYSDLLQNAIDEVDFREIAESYMEEFLDDDDEDDDESEDEDD